MAAPDDDRGEAIALAFDAPEAERERLRVAAELATFGVWDWDLQSDAVHWSSTLLRTLGIPPGRNRTNATEFFDRLHPDDAARVVAALEAHWGKGAPYDLMMRLRHEDGSFLTMRSRGQAFHAPSGEVRRMIGVIADITPEVATQAALEESERRFRDMSANVPGAVFRYAVFPDGSDRISHMNEGCRELWELPIEELEGDPTRLWQLPIAEDMAEVRASVDHAAATLEPWAVRYRMRTPAGKLKWVEARGLPMRKPDGTVVFNSVLFDVTEQVHMEEQLRESRELLFHAQKMDALGKLTGGMAHDFNNLLSVIMSGLEAAEGSALPAAQREALDDALSAAQRGAALTRSLLSFARRAELDPEVLELDDVVAEMHSLLRRTLPDNVALSVESVGSAARVHVDRSSLENALLNLVLNARDALPRGGHVTVRVALRDALAPEGLEAGTVVLSVEDDGEGMSADTLSRVFEPFFTTKGLRGSGMGLAMIHGFVQQSGGDIDVRSEVGAGTRVSLLFPLASEEDMRDSVVQPVDHARGVEELRVLFVEDEDAVRRSVARLLRRAGLDVTVAANGTEALRLIRAASAAYDVVVSDLRMPGPVQGEDLARQLGQTLPVLLLSGNPPEGRVPGAVATFTKPVSRDELVRAIATAAARGAAAQSA